MQMMSGYSSLLCPASLYRPAHHFLDAQVVVVALPVFDFVSAIGVLERAAIDEADFAADHLLALQMGDVDRF